MTPFMTPQAKRKLSDKSILPEIPEGETVIFLEHGIKLLEKHFTPS